MPEQITEEMNIHKQWYEDAGKQTIETLPAFINHIMNDYKHDYGTICHAITTIGLASMSAADNHPQGGITGFQAGCIMWEFIRHWNHSGNQTGLRLIDYDNFLYPQYIDKHQKTLSNSVWERIKKVAQEKIDEADQQMKEYQVKTEQYTIDIENFVKKYPDYYSNRKHYDHLGAGTGADWDAYYEKEKSGFEFAPREPFLLMSSDHPVYNHWKSIVNGKIPFGYTLKED